MLKNCEDCAWSGECVALKAMSAMVEGFRGKWFRARNRGDVWEQCEAVKAGIRAALAPHCGDYYNGED